MITACWSLKGGTGTSLVAAMLALSLARPEPNQSLPRRTVLVDLAGDQPVILGMSEPMGPGVAEWMAAGSSAPPDSLARLETRVAPGLSLIHRGRGDLPPLGAGLLVQVLGASGHRVVVDCGNLSSGRSTDAARQVAAEATRSLLVTRPCYVAIRRCSAAPIAPSGVVVVREPWRVLSDDDVAGALQVPVVLSVDVDPAIGRAVDSGLLTARLPRRFVNVMRAIA